MWRGFSERSKPRALGPVALVGRGAVLRSGWSRPEVPPTQARLTRARSIRPLDRVDRRTDARTRETKAPPRNVGLAGGARHLRAAAADRPRRPNRPDPLRPGRRGPAAHLPVRRHAPRGRLPRWAVAVAVDPGANAGADRTRYLVEDAARETPFWYLRSTEISAAPPAAGRRRRSVDMTGAARGPSVGRARGGVGLRLACGRAGWRLEVARDSEDGAPQRPGSPRRADRWRDQAGLRRRRRPRRRHAAALADLMASRPGRGRRVALPTTRTARRPAPSNCCAAVAHRAAVARRIAESRADGGLAGDRRRPQRGGRPPPRRARAASGGACAGGRGVAAAGSGPAPAARRARRRADGEPRAERPLAVGRWWFSVPSETVGLARGAVVSRDDSRRCHPQIRSRSGARRAAVPPRRRPRRAAAAGCVALASGRCHRRAPRGVAAAARDRGRGRRRDRGAGAAAARACSRSCASATRASAVSSVEGCRTRLSGSQPTRTPSSAKDQARAARLSTSARWSAG